MQYLLQIFLGSDTSAWAELSESEQQAITEEYLALRSEPGFVAGAQLHSADTATTVRVELGRTLTTDGPFPESREVLAGYYLFDVADLDAALALAARIPAARMGGAIEVRAVVER
ncbi:MAG: hypothetical protein QOH15_1477 [Gaiellales bacterium]|jgi:hypothetical protein|nr:hypothetical protein [Gaiellales bacterium]